MIVCKWKKGLEKFIKMLYFINDNIYCDDVDFYVSKFLMIEIISIFNVYYFYYFYLKLLC